MPKREWTREQIELLVWRTLEGDKPDAIAAALRACRKTVLDMQRELDLRGPKRAEWTAEEIEVVRRGYFETPTAEIAAGLGRTLNMVWNMANKLGLKKSPQLIADTARERTAVEGHGSRAHRFKPGIVPHNKGRKSPGVAPGRMRETQFRKGERSSNFMPLGSTRLIDGYLYRKVSEIPNVPYVRNWKLEHYLIWEQVKGPVPAGHALVFKDGNRGHVEIGNLELITRAELAQRNTIHNLPEPLKEVIRLNASIKRRIRRIDAEKQNDGSAEPSLRDARSA